MNEELSIHCKFGFGCIPCIVHCPEVTLCGRQEVKNPVTNYNYSLVCRRHGLHGSRSESGCQDPSGRGHP